jgi:hypothetical protein
MREESCQTKTHDLFRAARRGVRVHEPIDHPCWGQDGFNVESGSSPKANGMQLSTHADVVTYIPFRQGESGIPGLVPFPPLSDESKQLSRE